MMIVISIASSSVTSWRNSRPNSSRPAASRTVAVGDCAERDLADRGHPCRAYGTPLEDERAPSWRPPEARSEGLRRGQVRRSRSATSGPSPRRGPARRRASPSPRPCAPRAGPQTRRELSPATSPAAFLARPVILSMMLMWVAGVPGLWATGNAYRLRAHDQRGGPPARAREGRVAVAVRARAGDRRAAVSGLLPDAHLRRRAHPRGGSGDRRAEPQELLGLVLHRRRARAATCASWRRRS